MCIRDSAMSLAPMHITVNAVAPGWIHVDESEILRSEDQEFHPSGRVGKPEDIASMILFLCEPPVSYTHLNKVQ